MARKGSYLYKRAGSANYWLRLVYPPELAAHVGRARVERSLGTSNRKEAEANAAQEIAKHKLALLAVERQRQGKPQPAGAQKRFPPLTERVLDGLRVVATEDELLFFNKEGGFVRREPNYVLVDLTNTIEFALTDTTRAWLTHGTSKRARMFFKGKEAEEDEQIFNHWLEYRNITPHIKRDAQNAWTLFKEVAGSKPLRQCSIREAREFVEALRETGISDKTVAKKVSYLNAACNLAIREGVLKSNPFSHAAPTIKKDWEKKRVFLTEADTALVRKHLHELAPEDRLLWIWLATTGMRLSEPFQATSELEEGGIRYVEVGEKTAASRRRVPIPDEVLPLIPKKIEGCLFPESAETHGKRLRYFLRRLGISYDRDKETGDKRKTIHSLRHRAATRLRAASCPKDIRLQLLGHEIITVADDYGEGFPVAVLREWQRHIGY